MHTLPVIIRYASMHPSALYRDNKILTCKDAQYDNLVHYSSYTTVLQAAFACCDQTVSQKLPTICIYIFHLQYQNMASYPHPK